MKNAAVFLALSFLSALGASAADAPDVRGFDRFAADQAFSRADREASAEDWMERARLGAADVRASWERLAASYYPDARELAAAGEKLDDWTEEEIEARFAAWIKARFLAAGAAEAAAATARGAREADLALLYKTDSEGNILYDGSTGDPLVVRPEEGGIENLARDRAAWRERTSSRRDAALADYASRVAASYPELLAYIGEDRREAFSRVLEGLGAEALARGRAELDATLARSERLFAARRSGDVWSLRRKSEKEAAAAIGAALVKEAEAASGEAIDGLSTKIEAAAAGQGDLAVAGKDWLEAYKVQFRRGLEAWTAAEERFMLRRIEWERDAGRSLEAGEKAWSESFAALETKRRAWEVEARRLFLRGEAVFEKVSEDLQEAIGQARAEFDRDAALRAQAGADRARAWVDSYVTCGTVVAGARESAAYWAGKLAASGELPPAVDAPSLGAWLDAKLRADWASARDAYGAKNHFFMIDMQRTFYRYWSNLTQQEAQAKNQEAQENLAKAQTKLSNFHPFHIGTPEYRAAVADRDNLLATIQALNPYLEDYDTAHAEANRKLAEFEAAQRAAHPLWYDLDAASKNDLGDEAAAALAARAKAALGDAYGGEAAAARREARRWAILYGEYREKAIAARDALANEFGLAMGSGMLGGVLADGAATEDFHLDEYQVELLRARAVSAYWEKRAGIARAVDAYAKDLTAGRVTDAEGLAAWESAKAAYDAALESYGLAEGALRTAGADVAAAREAVAAAASKLAAADARLEKLNADYALALSAYATKSGAFILADLVDRFRDLSQAAGLLRGADGEDPYLAYMERARDYGASGEYKAAADELRDRVRGRDGEPSLAELARRADGIRLPADGQETTAPEDLGLEAGTEGYALAEAIIAERKAALADAADEAGRQELRASYGRLLSLAAARAKRKAGAAVDERRDAIALLGSPSAQAWYEGRRGVSQAGLSAEEIESVARDGWAAFLDARARRAAAAFMKAAGQAASRLGAEDAAALGRFLREGGRFGLADGTDLSYLLAADEEAAADAAASLADACARLEYAAPAFAASRRSGTLEDLRRLFSARGLVTGAAAFPSPRAVLDSLSGAAGGFEAGLAEFLVDLDEASSSAPPWIAQEISAWKQNLVAYAAARSLRSASAPALTAERLLADAAASSKAADAQREAYAGLYGRPADPRALCAYLAAFPSSGDGNAAYALAEAEAVRALAADLAARIVDDPALDDGALRALVAERAEERLSYASAALRARAVESAFSSLRVPLATRTVALLRGASGSCPAIAQEAFSDAARAAYLLARSLPSGLSELSGADAIRAALFDAGPDDAPSWIQTFRAQQGDGIGSIAVKLIEEALAAGGDNLEGASLRIGMEASFLAALSRGAAMRAGLVDAFGEGFPLADRWIAAELAGAGADAAYLEAALAALGIVGVDAVALAEAARGAGFDAAAEAALSLDAGSPLAAEAVAFRLKTLAAGGRFDEYRTLRSRAEARAGSGDAEFAAGMAAALAGADRLRDFFLAASEYDGAPGDELAWSRARLGGNEAGALELARFLATGCADDPFLESVGRGPLPLGPGDPLFAVLLDGARSAIEAADRAGAILRARAGFAAAYENLAAERAAAAADGSSHWRVYLDPAVLSGDARFGEADRELLAEAGDPEAVSDRLRRAAGWEEGCLADRAEDAVRASARLESAFRAWAEPVEDTRAGILAAAAATFLGDPELAWTELSLNAPSSEVYDAVRVQADRLAEAAVRESSLRREIARLGAGFRAASGDDDLKAEIARLSAAISAERENQRLAVEAYAAEAEAFAAAGAGYDRAYAAAKTAHAAQSTALVAYETQDAIRRWASTAYLDGGSGSASPATSEAYRGPAAELAYCEERHSRAAAAFAALRGLYAEDAQSRPYEDAAYRALYDDYRASFQRMMLAVKARDALSSEIAAESKKNDDLFRAHLQKIGGNPSPFTPLDYSGYVPADAAAAFAWKDYLRLEGNALRVNFDASFRPTALDASGAAKLQAYFNDRTTADGERHGTTAFEKDIRSWSERVRGMSLEKYKGWALARDYLINRMLKAPGLSDAQREAIGRAYTVSEKITENWKNKVPDYTVGEKAGDFRNKERVPIYRGLDAEGQPLYDYDDGLPALQKKAWEQLGTAEKADLEFFLALALTGKGGVAAEAFSRASELKEVERLHGYLKSQEERFYRLKSIPFVGGLFWGDAYADVAAVYYPINDSLRELSARFANSANSFQTSMSNIRGSLDAYRKSCARLDRLDGKGGGNVAWAGIRGALAETKKVSAQELGTLEAAWNAMNADNAASFDSVSGALAALTDWTRNKRVDGRAALENAWSEDEAARVRAEAAYRATAERYVQGAANREELDRDLRAAYGAGSPSRKNHLRALEAATRDAAFGLLGDESAFVREYADVAREYASLTERAYRARVDAERSAREAEWAQQARDLQEKRSAWRQAAGLILERGRADWTRGGETMRERYVAWRKEVEETYRASDEAWTAAYLEGLRDKEGWALRATEAARSAASGATLALVGSDAEALGRKLDTLGAWTLPSDGAEQARRTMAETLSSAGIVGMQQAFLSGAGAADAVSLAVRRGIGGVDAWDSGRAQAAAAAFARQTNAELAARQARLIASRARDAARDAVAALEENLKEANKDFRKSMDDTFTLGGQWKREGTGFVKDVLVHSTLFDPAIYETAHVAGYVSYAMTPWQLKTDLSDGLLETLDASGINALVGQAQAEVQRKSEEIFGGAADESDEAVAKRTRIVKFMKRARTGIETKTIVDYAGKASQIEVPVYGQVEDEAKRVTKTIAAGAFGAHIGYDPTLKEAPDTGAGVDGLWQDGGSGELGRLMRSYIYWSLKEQQGNAALNAPSWDKPMWDDRDSWLKAPTIRSAVDISVTIATAVVATVAAPVTGGASFAAAVALNTAMNMADDAVFTLLDVGGGYKSWEQAGLEFGKKTLATAASSAIGGVFNGFGKAGEGFFSSGLTGAVTASTTGMGTVVAKTAMAGLQSVTTSTVTSAINAIHLDGNGLNWSGDVFRSGFESGLRGAAVGMMGGFVTDTMNLGMEGYYGKIYKDGANLSRLAGGLAGQGLNYAMGGDFTLNLLNASDLSGGKLSGGLFELHLGRGGVTGNMGMGGVDASLGTVASAMGGIEAWAVNARLQFGKEDEGRRYASAMRTLYSGGLMEKSRFDSILQGTTNVVERADGDFKGRTVYDAETGITTIELGAQALADGSRFGMNILFAHEAYRNGVDDGAEGQRAETDKAVFGHIRTAMGLAGSYGMDAIGSAMANEVKAMQSYLSGNGSAALAGVLGNYDSSGDFWKLTADGRLLNDGEKRLLVEIRKDNGDVDWKEVEGSGNETSVAAALVHYLGKDRAMAIFDGDVNDISRYDNATLRDVLKLDDATINALRRDPRAAERVLSGATGISRDKLLGEALMKDAGIAWDPTAEGGSGKWLGEGAGFSLSDRSFRGNAMMHSDGKGGYERYSIVAQMTRHEGAYDTWKNGVYHEEIDGNTSITFQRYDLDDGRVSFMTASGAWNTVDNSDGRRKDAQGNPIGANQHYQMGNGNFYQGNTLAQGDFELRWALDEQTDWGDVFIVSDATTLAGEYVGMDGRRPGHPNDLRWLFHWTRKGSSDGCGVVRGEETWYDNLRTLQELGLYQGYVVETYLRDHNSDPYGFGFRRGKY